VSDFCFSNSNLRCVLDLVLLCFFPLVGGPCASFPQADSNRMRREPPPPNFISPFFPSILSSVVRFSTEEFFRAVFDEE